MRECRLCHTLKPLNKFKPIRNGDRTKVCYTCLQANEYKSNPDRFRRKAREIRVQYPERAVLQDCRKSDRKKTLGANDLTLEFVRDQLAKGCSYCGERELRITLDRIDNNLPHLQSNVLPACLRCNYMRGSMPYAAWCNLVSAVRQTRELGLFGVWRSVPMNRKLIPG